MKNNRVMFFLGLGFVFVLTFVVLWFSLNRKQQAQAATDIYVSPIHAGCYIAGPNDCRIHIEPLTINLAAGKKLVYFQVLASRNGGNLGVIYDFRPDVSNPLPASGSTVTPSQVAQDFAATCGASYSIYLQGQDTGDSAPYNLGSSAQFVCPSGVP